MKLEWLSYFVALADAQSFQKAAQQVHLTPQALSKSIGNLERYLGVSLFERELKRKGLTPAGEAFYEEATALLLALKGAETRMAVWREKKSCDSHAQGPAIS